MLGLDSNGMRVLLRLGYGEEDERYDKTYASVTAAASAEAGDDFDELIALHRLVRAHGQTICRNSKPECDHCPLTGGCVYYEEHMAG